MQTRTQKINWIYNIKQDKLSTFDLSLGGSFIVGQRVLGQMSRRQLHRKTTALAPTAKVGKLPSAQVDNCPSVRTAPTASVPSIPGQFSTVCCTWTVFHLGTCVPGQLSHWGSCRTWAVVLYGQISIWAVVCLGSYWCISQSIQLTRDLVKN